MEMARWAKMRKMVGNTELLQIPLSIIFLILRNDILVLVVASKAQSGFSFVC